MSLTWLMLSDSVVHYGCVLYRIDLFERVDGRAPQVSLLSAAVAHKEFVFKKRNPKEMPLLLCFSSRQAFPQCELGYSVM